MTRSAVWSLVASLALVCPLSAQGPDTADRGGLRIQSGGIYEGYTFGSGTAFDALAQMTVPVVADIPFGGRADLTVATGFAMVEMDLVDGSSRSLSGLIDTEARLAVTIVPDRLRLLLSGAVPTGIGSIDEADAVLLGALSNDLLNFSTQSLGGGGAVGIGVAGAASAGRASVGYGLHVRVPLSYEPVIGGGDEVRAGTDVRLRVGIESPVGRRAFFRGAAIVSARGRDELNGRSVNGVGNRVAGYASLDAPLGPGVATVWGSGLYRSDPALESTAVGAAFVPRGSLLSAGLRWAVGLGGTTQLQPEFEFRTASAATDAGGLQLDPLGDVFRLGARLHRPLATGAWIVVEAHGVAGTIFDGPESASARGFRGGVVLEWRP